MKIYSPEFDFQTYIPSKFTCDGKNVNPSLKIEDVPESAQSLVLIMEDPDAPSATFVHWVLANLSPNIDIIYENSKADGIELKNSFGLNIYGGPCPPSGVHRYFFKLFALDITLGLNDEMIVSDLYEAMKNHVIEEAHYIGLYSRKTILN